MLNFVMGFVLVKLVYVCLKGDNWDDLCVVIFVVCELFDNLFGFIQVEDSLFLFGIEFEINVDVEKVGCYGVDVVMVGVMVQLVICGIDIGEMCLDILDEEILICVCLFEEDCVLLIFDSFKVCILNGLVLLLNFVICIFVFKLVEIVCVD